MAGSYPSTHRPMPSQHECGLWRGPSLQSPNVCLLEASSPTGGTNLLLRLASVLEMRAQSLPMAPRGPLASLPVGSTEA